MEKDLGRIQKNENTDIVVRIDDFGGKPGLTIREYVTSDRYTGFTKAGVRIPAGDFKKFKAMIDAISEKDLADTTPKEKPVEKKNVEFDEDEVPDY